MITIARAGDTALVIQKTSSDSTNRASGENSTGSVSSPNRQALDSLGSPDPTAAPLALGVPTGGNAGSPTPTVVPADLDALRAQGMVIPVAGVAAKDLVDSFDDMRGGTRRHNALDIMAKRNTPVLAATSGSIVKLHNSRAGGITVYEADPTRRFVMMYGHLDSYRPGLKEGQAISRGDIIGFVGSTGNANPLAPHLHFQLTRNDNPDKDWWKGTPINPFPVLRPK